MKAMLKLSEYQLRDVIRSKWFTFYTLFFVLVSYGSVTFSGNASKVIVILLNVYIMFIPLASIVFSNIYFYHNRGNIVFLSTQPIHRDTIFSGIFIGTLIPTLLGANLGTLLPLLFSDLLAGDSLWNLMLLLLLGTALSTIFISLGFMLAVLFKDRLKGLVISVFLWLFMSALYDLFILMFIRYFQDYPIENGVLGFTLVNPIDLARISMLSRLDISALMGYTGVIFNEFFSGSFGLYLTLICLLLWAFIPFLLSIFIFRKQDLT
ncbi:MAG: ABC transporter permease subunit [Ignavibacteriales bacterium]|nr:ABC transporter permease subunit [Ignavibacteriales bacterium]MCF8306808.1 ABC transporter permease subunit [Ignavibacteriales bacterium]MCF8316763.1 ABC transporter permease subunit [Ignavibacteriales bacterium]MCF8438067.1 ABC transporter permease subunit [Ignavibacteriales bacterium]